jgi:small subunit ribosomal protein S20
MPITSSAKQALRKDRRRNVTNNRVRLRLRTSLKAFREASKSESLPQVYSIIDLAAKKKLIHKNKAARLKSQMSKLTVNAIAESPAKTKPVKSKSKKATKSKSKSQSKSVAAA